MSKRLLSSLQEALAGHVQDLRRIADELDFESAACWSWTLSDAWRRPKAWTAGMEGEGETAVDIPGEAGRLSHGYVG